MQAKRTGFHVGNCILRINKQVVAGSGVQLPWGVGVEPSKMFRKYGPKWAIGGHLEPIMKQKAGF